MLSLDFYSEKLEICPLKSVFLRFLKNQDVPSNNFFLKMPRILFPVEQKKNYY